MSSLRLHPSLFVRGGLVLGLASCLSACASSPQSLSDLPAYDLRGYYTSGPEGHWFRPCGAGADEEPWWVTFTGPAVAQREAAPFSELSQGGRRLFVRWVAAPGDRDEGAPAGSGPGRRYVLVRDIRDVRLPGAADCAE